MPTRPCDNVRGRADDLDVAARGVEGENFKGAERSIDDLIETERRRPRTRTGPRRAMARLSRKTLTSGLRPVS
jgi:hypothetical protein